MTFDVFGDFETRGYLRNSERLKNLGEVKRLEHRVFLKNLGRAVEHLKHVERLTYRDVHDTHRVLFRDVYPWAGEDRQTTAPDLAIGRGERNDLFAHPSSARGAASTSIALRSICAAICQSTVHSVTTIRSVRRLRFRMRTANV